LWFYPFHSRARRTMCIRTILCWSDKLRMGQMIEALPNDLQLAHQLMITFTIPEDVERWSYHLASNNDLGQTLTQNGECYHLFHRCSSRWLTQGALLQRAIRHGLDFYLKNGGKTVRERLSGPLFGAAVGDYLRHRRDMEHIVQAYIPVKTLAQMVMHYCFTWVY
jgi:hypothetical protein